MALVEIVSACATHQAVADSLFDTAAAWARARARQLDARLHRQPRVPAPTMARACACCSEGAADVRHPGRRDARGRRLPAWGPFELTDMIGHDVNFAVSQSVWNAYYNDPRFQPSLVQQELVEAGFIGRKSGRGFYDYRAGAERPQPRTEAAAAVPAAIAICGASPLALALADRLQAAGVAFTRAASTDGRIAEANGAVLFQTDGRSATQRAAETGIANLLLVDLALDYAKATRLALAVARPGRARRRRRHRPAAGRRLCGCRCCATCRAWRVMRTVAMLANEAADAVNQGVCDAAGGRCGDAPGPQLPARAAGLGRRASGLPHDPHGAAQPRPASTARTATASRR